MLDQIRKRIIVDCDKDNMSAGFFLAMEMVKDDEEDEIIPGRTITYKRDGISYLGRHNEDSVSVTQKSR